MTRPFAILSTLMVAAAFTILGACHDGPTGPTTCSFSVSPPDRSFAAAGGAGTVTLTASEVSCNWAASSGASWVTVTAGASGTGSGTVTYQVAANAGVATRTTTVVVGGQTHGVLQSGQPLPECTYALMPSSATVGDAGGTGSFAVTTPDGCGWSAVSSEPWTVVTGGSSGSGDGTVSFSVAENNGVTSRVTVITVGDQVFTVMQQAEQVACAFSVAPVQFTPCMPGGQLMTSVTASSPACSWTASTNVPWLTLPGGPNGQGTGEIRFDVSSNYDPPREGLVMVRWDAPTLGQNVQVQQAGCYYGVSQSAFDFLATGGAGSFDVVQQSDPINCGGPLQNRCVWSAIADVPWIVVTGSTPRQGDDRVSFTIQPNATGSMRTGTITVRSQVVHIAQGG